MPTTAAVVPKASASMPAAIKPATVGMPPSIANPADLSSLAAATPAVFKSKEVVDSGRILDGGLEGLDGLASQWGNLSLKPDVEGGSFVFQPTVAGSGCSLEAPPEFFLLGTVRAVEEFNPRTIEKAMKGAWTPRKEFGMTVIDDNLFLFRFTYRLDINRVLREGPWRFQEYVLALKEVPRGFVVPKESLVMVPFWVQLWGVPAMWQRVEVARFIGALVGEVQDVDPAVRRHTGGGPTFLRVKVDVNTVSRLVRGTNVVLGEVEVPVAFKYERLFKFCYYCGLVDHVLEECEETLRSDFSMDECMYGEWLKGIPPRSSPWVADNWKPLGSGAGNPFAQRRQGIPPGFRALPAPAAPVNQCLPAPPARPALPAPNDSKLPITFTANASEQGDSGAGRKSTFKRIPKDGTVQRQQDGTVGEDSGTGKRRRAGEGSVLGTDPSSPMD